MQWKPVLTHVARSSKYSVYGDKLCVHVNRRGDLLLSTASHEALGAPEFVQIVSDGNGRMGFRAGRKHNPCTYTVQDADHSFVRRLAAKSVSKKYGIAEDRTKTYDLYLDDGVLVLNLGQKPAYHG